MKWTDLKFFAVPVLLLTQNPSLAASYGAEGNTVFLSARADRTESRKSAHIGKIQEIIREINRDIQVLFDAILSSQTEAERKVHTRKLVRKIRFDYKSNRIKNRLEEMEIMAQNEEESVFFRIMAIQALVEHKLPRVGIRDMLKSMIFEDGPNLAQAAKEALESLQTAHSETGQKFSKLLSYRSRHDIREVSALIWIIIYEEHPDAQTRLFRLLSSINPDKQQIGLLIAWEMKGQGSLMIRNPNIRRRIRELNRHFFTTPTNSHLSEISIRRLVPENEFAFQRSGTDACNKAISLTKKTEGFH